MSVVTSIKWLFTFISHQIKLFILIHLLTVDFTSTDSILFNNLQKVMVMFCRGNLDNSDYIHYSCKHFSC